MLDELLVISNFIGMLLKLFIMMDVNNVIWHSVMLDQILKKASAVLFNLLWCVVYLYIMFF